MNEASARDVTLLQAFESAQPASANWTEDDRAWADRVALEAAGADVPLDEFVAQRARHAMQRLAPREKLAARWLAQPLWLTRWIAWIGAFAFVVGLAADSFGSDQRINLLMPPLWGVILWNIAVYAVLLGALLATLLRRTRALPGPLVRATQTLLRTRYRPPKAASGGSTAALRRHLSLWAARSRALAALRTETVLHTGAAMLAAGLVVGLYLRGLATDYRVVWESTFLSPALARDIVATLLAPASQLSGIALPDAADFAKLQASATEPGIGAPAARWIHLIALSLALFVVLPRLLLAIACALRARAKSRRFEMPLDDPYFRRLLRLQSGSAAQIVVWPYASTPTPQATLGLRAVLAGAFGARVALKIAPTVAYGDEDDVPLAADASTTHALVLFDLNATPEAENHGRFIQRLAAALPAGASLAVLIDESAFKKRFEAMNERVAQRQQAWRRCCEAAGAVPVFADLDAPVPAAIEPVLHAAFGAPRVPAA